MIAPDPPSRTAIAAHRGGAALWPENSRLAFRNAALMNVDFIEFDVHRSRDGRLVVHHDAELGRTAAGAGRVAEMDGATLAAARLVGAPDEGIPSLDEVLAILAPHPPALRLEIKQPAPGALYDGIEDRIVARLRDLSLLSRTTFTCFDPRPLACLRRRHGVRDLILLVGADAYEASGRDLGQVCRTAREAGAPEVAIRESQCRGGDAERCRGEGLRMGAFAVNDAAAVDRALAWRATAFTTDHPDLALARRAAYEARMSSGEDAKTKNLERWARP